MAMMSERSQIPMRYRTWLRLVSYKRYRKQILPEVEDEYVGLLTLEGRKVANRYIFWECCQMTGDIVISHVKLAIFVEIIKVLLSRF